MLDGAKLREMLERIEALYLGATTPGERAAAASARERIEARLGEIRRTDPAIEMQFNMRNPWSKKLLVALLRRYGFKPYRYYRQRHTTVMARVPEHFVNKTLWPEFLELDEALQTHINEVTDRLIAEGVHGDRSDPEVQGELPAP